MALTKKQQGDKQKAQARKDVKSGKFPAGNSPNPRRGSKKG